MNGFFKILYLLIFTVSLNQNTYGQSPPKSEVDRIQELISENKIDAAENAVFEKINSLKFADSYDSISRYIHIFGKIELLQTHKESLEKTLLLANEVIQNTENPSSLFETNLSLSKLYNEKGNAQKAYDHAETAKEMAMKLNNDTALVNADYYLSDASLKLGNLNLFEQNVRNAFGVLEQNPTKKFSNAARVYNLAGALMYLTSKPDSAIYYYEKGLTKVKDMELSPENQLYLPATIKTNMVLLKQSQNKYSEAMTLISESIRLYNRFLKTTKNHPLEFRVHRNLSLAYRNLCSLYNDQGEFEKMNRIAELAYFHAKQNLPNTTIEHFSAITLLAETKLSKNEPLKAIAYLDEAEVDLNKMTGENFLLKANLYTIKGKAYYEMGNYKEANYFYTLGEQFHDKAQPDEISRDRMFAIINMSFSYAKLGDIKKANDVLLKAYGHFSQNEENTYLKNKVLLALAKVNLIAENYTESLKWSEESLGIYENNDTSNVLDKLHFEENKPELLLLNTKAKYFLDEQKDVASLQKLLNNLEEAIDVLEQRKSFVYSVDNVNNLIQDNLEVFDFAKKINLETYNLTNDKNYLNRIISLHESALYNRIRARLNLKEQTGFKGVPKDVLYRETTLKDALNNNLTNENFDSFIKSDGLWNSFLDSLKQHYPKYYKMRYATLEHSLDNLEENIPQNTTIVRYLFVDDKLYAFVATKNNSEIFALNPENLKAYINKLNEGQFEVLEINHLLHKLYQKLWRPFEKVINTESVIIFPDGDLYNLSFETLTPIKIESFKEMATESLLARHNISYNYSLLLLDKNRKTIDYSNNFIAFVPEFTDKMKNDYKIAITDSLDLDKTYLTLLPQPFSKNLGNQFSQLFSGSTFINENASKGVFTSNAKEHKIIHIGTHAESNNINPELSRLIFAKNAADTVSFNDNSLYTYEIYNQNFASNLAILTACETGKPTYQAGEGMISLAHAFNYAGSESILTSLWQIDEVSSTEIVALFYNYLEKGFNKDKALKQAKIDYIVSSKGRTVHPQYWAGLVLMGDATAIDFNTSNTKYILFLLLGGLILTILIFMNAKRKNRTDQ